MKKTQRAESRERWLAVLAEPDVIDRLCAEVANGCTIYDVCKKWDVPYSVLHAWVHDKDSINRLEKYTLALEARQTYFTESVLSQLIRIGWSDIRRLYDAKGKMLPPEKIPEDVAASIASLDVEYGIGGKVTRKARLLGKIEALQLLGRTSRMFTDRTELSGPNGGPLRVEPVSVYLPDNGRGKS